MLERDMSGDFGRSPITKGYISDNKNLSNKKPEIDWTFLKSTINQVILIGIQLDRPKHEIGTLIDAGDLVDNIRDEIELKNHIHPHESILYHQDIVLGV